MPIIQNNKVYTIGNITGSHDKLPVGNYTLQFNESNGQFFLTQQIDFKLPSKLYGDFNFIDRWIKSYEHNSAKNLGILLSGTKGTGKTVAAQLFCQRMNKPVIFITEAYNGPGFEAFISDPHFSDSIIFIDEFEKVYRRDEESNSLLTLMDGMYHTKLIFLLTANDPSSINNKLKNRLNRVKYHKIYSKLDAATVAEIVDDLLKKPAYRDSVDKFVETVDMLTMDVLTSIIREVNLFDESALECAKFLNLTAEPEYFNITVTYKGTDYKCDGQFVNYRKNPVIIAYYQSGYPKELTKLLPDYTSVKLFERPYSIIDGVVVCKYAEGVEIKLSKSSYALSF